MTREANGPLYPMCGFPVRLYFQKREKIAKNPYIFVEIRFANILAPIINSEKTR